jgi:AraC-like DNA-binding protein
MSHRPVTVRTGYAPDRAFTSAAAEVLDRWLAEVRVIPGKAREWRGADRWEVGPRRMESALWLWLDRGCGRARVGEQEHRLRPGDVLLARGDVEHWVWLEPTPELVFVTVHFRAQVHGGLDLLRLVGAPAHLPAETGVRPGPRGRRLAREYALREPGWHQAMQAELLGFLVHLVRSHGHRLQLPDGAGLAADLQRLLPALLLLERDLGRCGLTVAELARQAQVSEVYLRRLFHRIVGAAPAPFLQRQRVQRASALLRSSDRPIKEIAATCGFAQVPFFYRVFRRWTGVTPGRYRAGDGID